MEKDYLIKKWLNGELTTLEKEAFEKSDDFALNQSIIDEAQHFEASHFVDVPAFDTLAHKLYEPRQEANVKESLWIKYTVGIAAAILFMFSLYTVLDNGESSFETGVAQTEMLTLPDKSQVALNAKSSLSFNSKTWKEQRIVQLNGEAFFDVEKGAQFKVQTERGFVTVLGTEFNVRQRTTTFEVTCYEGKVAVTYNDKSITLLPGESMSLRGSQLMRYTIKTATPTWRNSMSTFKNAPAAEVFTELQRQYPIHLTFNNVNKSVPFTGSFKHGNLAQALEAITQPLELEFDIKSAHEVTISKRVQ